MIGGDRAKLWTQYLSEPPVGKIVELEEKTLATQPDRTQKLQQIVVTASQMSAIEAQLFDAGMPVAALMEKVGGLLTQRIQALYSRGQTPQVGIVVGPGHNGGDALVVGRELHLLGYEVKIYQPIAKQKDLTASHAQYAAALGIPCVNELEALRECDLIIDGLFGFGLTRSLEGDVAKAVDQINQWSQQQGKPIVSLDIPSGLHTDTGEVLGTAIRATHTFCLGLWKLAFLQDQALAQVGTAELIDIGLPLSMVQSVLGEDPDLQRITVDRVMAALPLPRPQSTHKYKQGHLLLICGSHQYMGGAILTALGARASGVGMLSIAVPESLKPIMVAQLPDALVLGCAERDSGAIANLPEGTELNKFSAVACGPGLTPDAETVVRRSLDSDSFLVLDADGLNILAKLGTLPTLAKRTAPTILTPHLGEYKRLFPDLAQQSRDRTTLTRSAAQQSGAVVLLKGARVAIANPGGKMWFNPASTPALARGGSGDVLTGLIGGLLAQAAAQNIAAEALVQSAVWWHSQAGILAAQERTELGVDAFTLTQYLAPVLRNAESLR